MTTEKKQTTTATGLAQQWSELQKAWMDNLGSLAETATGGGKSFFKPEQFQEFTEKWLKTQSEFLRKGFEMSHLFPTPDLTERFTKAMEAQLEVFRWWANAAVKAVTEGGAADPSGLMDAWRKSYAEIVEKMMPGPLAAPFQSWFGSTSEMPGNISGLMGEWSRVFTDTMRKTWSSMPATPGGMVPPEQVKDLYDSWIKAYEETLGRWFNLPSIGPLRRNQELYQRALDSYVRLYAANFEYASKLLEPSVEAFEDLTQKTAEMMKGDMTPDAFRQLYQEMIQTAEKRFRVLFESDEFVRSLQTTLDASLSFYRESQELTEEYLKSTPIITRTEMDEVHEEVYQLRRDLDELKRKFNSIGKGS